MKRISWILAVVFGIAFIGATVMNAALVGKARAALAGAYRGGAPSGSRPAAGGPTAGRPSPARTEAERFQLVVVLPDTDDSFFGGLLDGVSQAAAAAGAAVQVFRYPGTREGEADMYFEIALRAKVDGLIMYTPRDGRGSAAARAAEAARNGVVFIPVGTDAPPGEDGPFIGSGSLLQGMEGGKLIGKFLGASARVGIVISTPEVESGADDPLYRGVRMTLGSLAGARIVAVAATRPGILSGEAVIEAMLRAHPAINAVLCSNARDSVGAAQVLVDWGEVGKVLIIGADETPDIQRYIDKGVIAASVVRDSRWIGEEAVRVFSRLKAGGMSPAPVETGFLVIKTKKSPL
jgi:ribose transport system substrate-binding protein